MGGQREGPRGGLLWHVVFPVNGGSGATIRGASRKSTCISEPTNRDMILEISSHLEIDAENLPTSQFIIFSGGAFACKMNKC